MYTYIKSFGDQVFCTTYDEQGNKKYNKWNIKPYAFMTTNKSTGWKSFPCNKNLTKQTFSSISAFKKEKAMYSNEMLYGAISDLPVIQSIRDKKVGKEYNLDYLDVRFFDIEVFSPDEFPKANEANHPISSISVRNRKQENFTVWALTKDFSLLKAFKKKYPEFNECESFEKIQAIANNKKFKEKMNQKIEEYKNELKKQRSEMKAYSRMLHKISLSKEESSNKNTLIEYESVEKRLGTICSEVIIDYMLENHKKIIQELSAKIKKLESLHFELNIYNNSQFFYFDNEAKMMKHFCKYIGSCGVDMLLGWFSEGFDMPYIYNRCKKLLTKEEFNKISPYNFITKDTYYDKEEVPVKTFKIPGIIVLDMLDIYKTNTYSSKPSYKLNDIAQDELGLSKLDYTDEGSLGDLWIKNKQKYIEYNMQDVELLYLLDKELGHVDLIVSLCYYCGITIEKYYARTDLWTAIYYNEAMDRNLVIPSRKSYPKGKGIMGGYCKAPILDRYDWVISFDLNSLYPSLIMQYNLSNETKLPSELTNSKFNIINEIINGEFDFTEWKEKKISLMPLGPQFCNKKKGLVPIIIDKLYTQRKAHKKEGLRLKKLAEKETDSSKKKQLLSRSKILLNKQHAEKILLNALYGALIYKDKKQNKAFVLYDKEMAESITSMGQASIKYVEKNLNEFLNKILKTDKDYVIAMDTDSIYINAEEFVKKISNKDADDDQIADYLDNLCKNMLEPKINEIYTNLFNTVSAFENRMVMKREIIAKGAFWTAKKRYAALVLDDEGIRYKEPKEKFVGLQIVRSDTPDTVKEFLKKAVRMIIEGKDYDSYMKYIEKKFYDLEIEDMAFPKGVNNIQKYYEFKQDTMQTWRKGCPMHVRASIIHNNLIDKLNLNNVIREIKSGQKIKYIHLVKMNPVNENVVAFVDRLPEQFNLRDFVDVYEMYRKSFKKPLDDILKNIKLDDSSQTMDFDIII
jgi:DNA polymerase elongation subunit (family B)